MRIILGIIAFTLTFGLSATLVGVLFGFPQPEVKPFVTTSKYNSVHKNKIKSLLRRDVRNGNMREQAFTGREGHISRYNSPEYGKAVNDYYIKSSSMNDSMLPDDFKYAWREHMKAWKNQAEYSNSLKDEHYQENDSVRKYSDNTGEVNRTWYQVLRIAERYGVQTRHLR